MTMLLCNTMQYILVSICPLTISTIYFFINCVADNAITPFWYISNIVEVAMWGRPWATNAYTALTLTSSTLSSCKKYNAVKRDQAVQENQRSSYEMTTTFVQLCVLNTAAPTAFACLMQTLHSDKLSRTQLSSSTCTLPVFCDIVYLLGSSFDYPLEIFKSFGRTWHLFSSFDLTWVDHICRCKKNPTLI